MPAPSSIVKLEAHAERNFQNEDARVGHGVPRETDILTAATDPLAVVTEGLRIGGAILQACGLASSEVRHG